MIECYNIIYEIMKNDSKSAQLALFYAHTVPEKLIITGFI